LRYESGWEGEVTMKKSHGNERDESPSNRQTMGVWMANGLNVQLNSRTQGPP
jgi:hypothetical protein